VGVKVRVRVPEVPPFKVSVVGVADNEKPEATVVSVTVLEVEVA
jgi:hypothetical protein